MKERDGNKMRGKISKLLSILLIILIVYIIFDFNISNAESVKTMKIVIDPGHGGYETGAINYDDGIMEKDITLKTSRYLREFFNKYYGVEVIMTHDGLDSSTEMSIVDRGMVARNNNADLLLCLHFNAAASGTSWYGAEVYVTDNTSCYKYNQESTEIGNLILRNLSNLGIYNRGVKTRLCQDEGPKWEYSDGSKADYYGIIIYAMKGNAEDRGPDITDGSGITSKKVNWTTSNNKVATVDENGNISAVGEGEATIKAVADGNDKISSEVKVKVTNPRITIQNGEKASILLNTKVQLFTDTGVEDSKITWKSSDDSIVTVDANGLITGVKEGNANVIATYEEYNKTDSIQITVNTLEENEKIEFEDYKEANGVISNFAREIKPEEFKKHIKITGDLTIKINTEEFVGSGTIIEIYRGEDCIQTYTCKLYGDVNGDGKISAMDYMLIKNKIMEVKDITGTIQKDVADVNSDGKVSALDYMLIKNDILDVKKIDIK